MSTELSFTEIRRTSYFLMNNTASQQILPSPHISSYKELNGNSSEDRRAGGGVWCFNGVRGEGGGWGAFGGGVGFLAPPDGALAAFSRCE